MNGMMIGIQETNDTFCLQKTFVLKNLAHATLRITALGLYVAEINGKRVGDARMTPGWTSYQHVLQFQEYDVSSLLQEGENILCITVSGGWYSSGLGFSSEGHNIRYGEKPSALAELTIGNETIVTDLSWKAKESFIRSSGIYDGEHQDFVSPLKDLHVEQREFDPAVLVPQTCEPVRDIERLPVQNVLHSPEGQTIYDFGQNLTGVPEIKTPKDFKGTITLRFSEILHEGRLYSEGYRTAKCTDVFVVEGERVLVPEFTFHGFRYMGIEGVSLPQENVHAIVRHTDLNRTGKVTTSHPKLQKLIDNILWSQKDNSLDIPSDCPQRNERMGWTGDANIFLKTASFQFDVRSFFRKWLRDLRFDQAETGEVSQVVPDILGWKNTATIWCDAVCMIPWTLYETYGDESFLTDNYEAMAKYLEAVHRTTRNGIVVEGQQYGDWLALDQEKEEKFSCIGRTDVYFLATVFYAEDLRIASISAQKKGLLQESEAHQKRREEILGAIRREYVTPSGRLALDTMTAEALALRFHLVPKEAEQNLAKRLNDRVIGHDYKCVTGIIGTKYLLNVLAEYGYFDTACKILLNEKCPGWLYEVNHGATTMWENWNSIKEDGSLNVYGMDSFNHPFFGTCMEFIVESLCGIQAKEPGYRRVLLSPHPSTDIKDMRAEFDSVSGKIVSGYRIQDGEITYEFVVPVGVEAKMKLPGEEPAKLLAGRHVFTREFE